MTKFGVRKRDLEGSPELSAQLAERASEIVEITNDKGGKEKIIKRA